MSIPALRPLGFGEILDGAFAIYRRHFGTLIATSALGMVSLFVLIFAAGLLMAALESAFLGIILVILAAGTGVSLMWSSLAFQTSQAYTKGKTSISDGMEDGGRGTFPAMWAGAMVMVVLIVAVTIYTRLSVSIVSAAAGTGSGTFAAVVGLAVLLGMFALYLLIASLFFAIVPAVVVEDRGPIEALGRSFQLARGALGRIAGLIVVIFIICYLPIVAVAYVTGTASAFSSTEAILQLNPRTILLQQLLNFVVAILTTPFMVSAIVLQYYDRRVRTEALDVQMATEQLAVAR